MMRNIRSQNSAQKIQKYTPYGGRIWKFLLLVSLVNFTSLRWTQLIQYYIVIFKNHGSSTKIQRVVRNLCECTRRKTLMSLTRRLCQEVSPMKFSGIISSYSGTNSSRGLMLVREGIHVCWSDTANVFVCKCVNAQIEYSK